MVVVVGLEMQTGDNGSRSLGGTKLCCIRPFGIACRNSVDGVESGEKRRSQDLDCHLSFPWFRLSRWCGLAQVLIVL